MLLLLPVLVLIRYPIDGLDQDMWWQMAIGRYMVEHLCLKMDLTIFSWTPADANWIYSAPLGSIAMYLFYKYFGGFGLWLMQWSVFIGVFALYYSFLKLIKLYTSQTYIDVFEITFIYLIAIICSWSLRFYKPELFSGFFIPLIAYVFYYVKINHRPKVFLAYPLIFMLWVNVHGCFMAGLVILGIIVKGETLNRVFSKDKINFPELKYLYLSFALSLLAVFVNPYGWHYVYSVLQGFFIDSSFHNSQIMAYYTMWGHLRFCDVSFMEGGLTVWLMSLIFIGIVSLSFYNIKKNRDFDFTIFLMAIVLFYQGMTLARSSYFFPLVSFFLFFYQVHKMEISLNKYFIPAAALYIILSTGIVYYIMRYQVNQYFGVGVELYAPVDEVEFLKKAKITGTIFNDYVIGGYLTWALYPDHKVFIDPRGGLYMKHDVFKDYIYFSRSDMSKSLLTEFNKKYPFQICVLHYREIGLIFRILTASEGDWRLLYFGKNAVILIRKDLLPEVLARIGSYPIDHKRFKDVKDPSILTNLFVLYAQTNMTGARYIRDVFQKNVPGYYLGKANTLNYMNLKVGKQ